jgi:hypothetical protein
MKKLELTLILCAISSAKDVGISWLMVNRTDAGKLLARKEC